MLLECPVIHVFMRNLVLHINRTMLLECPVIQDITYMRNLVLHKKRRDNVLECPVIQVFYEKPGFTY